MDQAFTAFSKEVGFNNGLSAPQPDFFEGLQFQEFLPFPAHKQLGSAVLIKDDPYSITLPHLAGEWKGPGNNMNKARVQSAYDGAALVYGRDQALEFVGEPDPLGYTAVSTFTTDGTNINFFSHYSAPSKEGNTTELETQAFLPWNAQIQKRTSTSERWSRLLGVGCCRKLFLSQAR
ncbi:hypothetical protein F4779DRAFT_326382 [Xylariaceae sp. FL0662B]|nr:hypothetical protein F4779DRAFT_326382 [Xylariaceae sp. FL0662B]